MGTFQRREFLAGAAAFAAATTAALTGAREVEAGDLSFMNNVPDPLLAGKELPTFKFALEKSRGKVIGDSFGKEATVEQLPISKGIAGVSMKLEPGAMRELHWHATAAEWAYVLEGQSGAPVRRGLACSCHACGPDFVRAVLTNFVATGLNSSRPVAMPGLLQWPLFKDHAAYCAASLCILLSGSAVNWTMRRQCTPS